MLLRISETRHFTRPLGVEQAEMPQTRIPCRARLNSPHFTQGQCRQILLAAVLMHHCQVVPDRLARHVGRTLLENGQRSLPRPRAGEQPNPAAARNSPSVRARQEASGDSVLLLSPLGDAGWRPAAQLAGQDHQSAPRGVHKLRVPPFSRHLGRLDGPAILHQIWITL